MSIPYLKDQYYGAPESSDGRWLCWWRISGGNQNSTYRDANGPWGGGGSTKSPYAGGGSTPIQ